MNNEEREQEDVEETPAPAMPVGSLPTEEEAENDVNIDDSEDDDD